MQVGMLETKNISWKELDKYNSITESITLNEVKAAGKKFISDQSPLVTILNPKMRLYIACILFLLSSWSSANVKINTIENNENYLYVYLKSLFLLLTLT